MSVQITPMAVADWPQVREIYKQGIATQNATFETESPDWEAWDKQHSAHTRLVAVIDGVVAGWAALRPISGRQVYSGVAEVSIYVSAGKRGCGIGKELLKRLIAQSEAQGVWTLQAAIFPENVPSLSVHQKLGFRTVGIRERLGRMGDRWRDVVLLERRSSTVGL